MYQRKIVFMILAYYNTAKINKENQNWYSDINNIQKNSW